MTVPDSSPMTPSPPRRPARKVLKYAILSAVAVATLAAGWMLLGARAWEDYKVMRDAQREAEDSAPVGYLGANYRRSYNNRPIKFGENRDGRRLLIAAMGDNGRPTDFYDVTDTDLDPDRLGGGFGRDSIPGVDFPIFEPPTSPLGQKFRDRMPIFAVTLKDGPRVYPRELLAKVELVNDRDGSDPFVVVFDRSRDRAWAYGRLLDGREVTFGTTGYALEGRPLLYDRATKGLWMPGPEGLRCLCGEFKGRMMELSTALEATRWGEWRSGHPGSKLLVGNDRDRPIPDH